MSELCRPKFCGGGSAMRSSRSASFRTGRSRTTSRPFLGCSNGSNRGCETGLPSCSNFSGWSLKSIAEPFGAVDPITRDALQAELARIHRATTKTIVFVTHDIEEALRLATQIAILHEGQIAQFGPPLEILEHPASDFVSDFVSRQGLGLKLLSVRRIGDHVRAGETAEGEPLSVDTSLRDALSVMITRRAERLPVCDVEGHNLGVIALADLVR